MDCTGARSISDYNGTSSWIKESFAVYAENQTGILFNQPARVMYGFPDPRPWSPWNSNYYQDIYLPKQRFK